jgi:hypothetical protein
VHGLNIWEKLQAIDRRIIYLLFIIALAIPTVKPVSLPLPPDKASQDAFNLLDGLSAGSVVWISADYGAATLGENGNQLIAIVDHAFRKNLKVIAYAMWPDGGKLSKGPIEAAAAKYGKQYGVDYVRLGFKPGGAVTLKLATTSISDAAQGIDEDGANLADLPLMQQVTALTAGQVAAWVSVSSGTPGYDTAYVPMAYEIGKVPGFAAVTAVSAPGALPYYRAEQIKGLLVGLSGAADYEGLNGTPAAATRGIGVQSFGHLVIIAFIVLGNVGYVLGKSK